MTITKTTLDKIASDVREDVERRKIRTPLAKLPSRSTDFRSLSRAIGSCRYTPVIAEIKPKSPSEGILKQNLDITALAKEYEAGGAVGISILTEPTYFGGSLKSIIEVKEAVGLPVLGKDFVVDEYQIHESVAYGADSILLIPYCAGEKLLEFSSLAKDFGLEAIIECHSQSEVERAVEIGAKIIGVNNRDLRTFKVDLSTTKQLARHIPNDRILISESGIKTAEDVRLLMETGANAVLIGTALMKAKDPEERLRGFIRAT